MRRYWIGAGVVLATLLALGGQTAVVTRTGFLAGDFRAFYCAANVASYGHDPYHTEPLRTCERRIGPKLFFRKNPSVTIPAPLPGYAIAALVPLARMPFPLALAFWELILLAAWIAGVVALARCAGVFWAVALAALGLSLGTLSLPFGEVVPIAVGCMCLAAAAAQRGRWIAAAVAAAGTMIEPHLGLPVCIALAIWARPTRIPLGIALAALGALSLLLLGPAVNIEYFSSVLPAHALSEITRDTQYSTSSIVAAFGAPPQLAARAGFVWYLAMVIIGTIVAGRLYRKTGNAAWLACVPPAFAVFGGSFIHITQIAAAVPAAVLLVSQSTTRGRVLTFIALLLLAVPWGWAVSPALIVAPFVPIGFLAWTFWEERPAFALVAATIGAAMLFGLQHLYAMGLPHFGVHPTMVAVPKGLPEASWSAYSLHGSSGSVAAWAVRVPTWTALALLLLVLIRTAGFARVRVSTIVQTAAVAAFIAVPIAAQTFADRSNGWLGVDFRAYYCAALSQRVHDDPYLASSLHSCEAKTPAPYFHPQAAVTVPAPYPPYVLALLAPLTMLPFTVAMSCWWLILLACLAIAALGLSRITRQPLGVGIAAIGLAAGLTSFSSGNMLPIGLAGLIFAAWQFHEGKVETGIIGFVVAMLEPQIALPAAIAAFCIFPASRVSLVALAVLMAGVSFMSAGPKVAISYVTSVLPAHALSEVTRDNQYSLATIAGAMGVPDAYAAALGTLSYGVMTIAGVILGVKLYRRFEEPALCVFVPTALSLLGGSFVHTGEIAAAVPAALVLARYGELRAWFLAALVLLTVPWMYATSAVSFLAPIVPAGYLVYHFQRERITALSAAGASFAIIAGLFLFSATHHAHYIAAVRSHPFIDPQLAEASWRRFVLGNSSNGLAMWLLRLPTWCGLLVLAGASVSAAVQRRSLVVARIAS